MTNPFRHLTRSRQGMTLVELMVVIAVPGMLTATLASSVTSVCCVFPLEATVLSMSRIEQGLQIYSARNRGRFPSTAEGLEAARMYMPSSTVPRDGWGNTFLYLSPGMSADEPYEIISLGADKEWGGDGPNADILSRERRR
jgi:general secretion pathway protein G